MKRVLVTGASGFIGREVIGRLAGGDWEVAGLGRSPASDQRIAWLQADLLDHAATAREVAAWRPEVLIHLGWYAEPGRYLVDPLNTDLLHASIALVKASLAAGCRRIVGAGTCAEYDSAQAPFSESGPTAPTTLYAASKLALHLVGAQLAAQAGAIWTWGRIFLLYGPREDARRLVPGAITALLGGRRFPCTAGTQLRDFLHVGDVAAAFVRLAQDGEAGIYDIASGQPVSIAEVLGRIGALTGRGDLLGFGERQGNTWDPPAVWAHARRLRALGWAPTIDLDAGLTQTIDWWRNTPALP